MRKSLFFILFISLGCDTGNLTVLVDLPNSLYEVSGIETATNSTSLWMLNDGGNKSELFKVNLDGRIESVLKINAKNRDWEDLTTDSLGNIYIGDFGNNRNKRKNLAILKVSKDSLNRLDKIDVERISFHYEDQQKFPPKKKQLNFDCEAFFHFNDSLYLFTKSRIKNEFGKTKVYKIPAKRGQHEAKLIGSFTTCEELPCWITSADISSDGKTMVLLTLNSVWTFTNFEGDDFFGGTAKSNDLGFVSQKESICFKDSNTVYIADELANGSGGNLYEFNLKIGN